MVMSIIAEKPLSELSITSPYLFINGHDGVTVGSNPAEILLQSNVTALDGSAIALDAGSVAADVWAANGWMTGDGVADYFTEATTTDYDTICQMTSSCIMFWAQVNAAPADSDCMFRYGGSTNTYPGWEVRYNGTSDRVDCRVRGSTGLADVATGSSTITDSTDTNIACLFNGNADTVTTYINGTDQSATTDVSGNGNYTTVHGGATSSISVLAGDTNGSINLPYVGKIRRIGIINFGASYPSNIDAIIAELNTYNSIPYWLLDGA